MGTRPKENRNDEDGEGKVRRCPILAVNLQEVSQKLLISVDAVETTRRQQDVRKSGTAERFEKRGKGGRARDDGIFCVSLNLLGPPPPLFERHSPPVVKKRSSCLVQSHRNVQMKARFRCQHLIRMPTDYGSVLYSCDRHGFQLTTPSAQNIIISFPILVVTSVILYKRSESSGTP